MPDSDLGAPSGESPASDLVDVYCNACGLRVTEPAPDDNLAAKCPKCGSPRRMMAPHPPDYATLADATDAEFDAFVGRVWGIRSIGRRQIAIGFELPWLQYDNEAIRSGLRTVAPEAAIEVPHRKVGETRGPAEDLLVWYQPAFALAEQIVVWWGMGLIAKSVIEYLRGQAPWVRINEGVALSLGAEAIYERLGKVSMDYAFVLSSKNSAPLAIAIAEHAFLVGFESEDVVAWAVISDEGDLLAIDSARADRAPEWWPEAKAIDLTTTAATSPRADEW